MKSRVVMFFKRHIDVLLIGVLITSAFVVTGGMISSIRSNIDTFGLVTAPNAEIVSKSIAVAAGEQYIVKEYDGRIGVFIPGDTQPVRVVQVYVVYLPESDKTSLREGITVNGRTALENLINDFTS